MCEDNLTPMCGIAGVLRPPGQAVELSELQLMAGALAHRGPDDEGFYVDGNLGLAHRRLAILDLTAAGHQPMSNEKGTVWTVYNGQLYDFARTRDWLEGRGHRFRSRTDTEILVHLYEEKGEHLLEEIDGMFAFGLWDTEKRRLLLARDRLGIKPLYYYLDGSCLAFASELKALLALPWLGRNVDLPSLMHYLFQSSVPGSRSMIQGVRKLAPGQYLVVEDGRSQLHTYWKVSPDPDPDPEPFDQAAISLGSSLERAVKTHLIADVPVGVFLSGGLDSTAVALSAGKALGYAPHSFSVRFHEKSGEDEGPAAREVAESLGTIHHELFLGPECAEALLDMVCESDEPFAISSALALHHLSRFARGWVKVVLTGDGADEILGGYPWRHEPERGKHATARSRLHGLALTLARSRRGARAGEPGLPGQLRARLGRTVHRPDERYAEIVHTFIPEEIEALVAPDLREIGRQAWLENPVRLRYQGYKGDGVGDEVNRRLHTDLSTTLVDEMLTKVDRMTMAASLEARVPFLDRALVEWAFRQPGRYKVRGGAGKLLLRRYLRDRLPRAAARPKHGFNLPLGRWLRGPLRELVQDTLSLEAVRRRGLFRPEAVQRLLAAHLQGRGDHARKVFTILVLEIWLSQMKGERPTGQLAVAQRMARHP